MNTDTSLKHYQLIFRLFGAVNEYGTSLPMRSRLKKSMNDTVYSSSKIAHNIPSELPTPLP
jgi:hypothetical protein